ncbi:hypothetical protein [Agrobacterium sp.]|jgi:hypothetical protein|uniref:hypothetical protein n=1 Tax=Agrobacterium sp. TaxID=361 RepID=UPI0028AF1910|nr:hypothetical protein [Agrobacterium sp.]
MAYFDKGREAPFMIPGLTAAHIFSVEILAQSQPVSFTLNCARQAGRKQRFATASR